MQINQAGLALIEKWEGFFDHAYNDGEGVITIGYGTTRWDLKTPIKMGQTITREVAEDQLRQELQRVQDAIDTAVRVPLSSNEHAALCSIFYNIGTGWCTGKGHQQATFIKNLNAGRKDLVPAGMLQFVRGANTGKAYSGLLNRRKDEVKLWLTPDVVDNECTASDPMPQAVVPRSATPAVASAAASSWTIRGAAAAALGVAGQAAEKATGYASGMAADISAQVQQASPLRDLAGKFLAHTDWILLGLMGVGIVIVVSRRLSAAAQGREG
jgi:lysozyme